MVAEGGIEQKRARVGKQGSRYVRERRGGGGVGSGPSEEGRVEWAKQGGEWEVGGGTGGSGWRRKSGCLRGEGWGGVGWGGVGRGEAGRGEVGAP